MQLVQLFAMMQLLIDTAWQWVMLLLELGGLRRVELPREFTTLCLFPLKLGGSTSFCIVLWFEKPCYSCSLWSSVDLNSCQASLQALSSVLHRVPDLMRNYMILGGFSRLKPPQAHVKLQTRPCSTTLNRNMWWSFLCPASVVQRGSVGTHV